MTRRLCEAPSCRSSAGEREISPGFRFCGRCRQQLAIDLAELPTLYDACERALEYTKENMVGRVNGWWPGHIWPPHQWLMLGRWLEQTRSA